MFGLFKKKKKEEEPVKPATLDNLKVGAFIEFDYFDVSELSKKSVEIKDNVKFSLPNKSYDFVDIDNYFYLRKFDSQKIEIMLELSNPQDLLDSVDEDFYGLLEIDENEILENGHSVELVSNERNFTINAPSTDWLQEGTYYRIDDTIDASFGGTECRFFRFKSADGQSFISSVTFEGGETYFYLSRVFPKRVVEDVLG